jgi:hypothetical protein
MSCQRIVKLSRKQNETKQTHRTDLPHCSHDRRWPPGTEGTPREVPLPRSRTAGKPTGPHSGVHSSPGPPAAPFPVFHHLPSVGRQQPTAEHALQSSSPFARGMGSIEQQNLGSPVLTSVVKSSSKSTADCEAID